MNITSAAQSAINESVYLKNPETSELGQRIVRGGLEMIESLGFENFTFKKLAEKIGTTEASVYRYFESKHKLLLYLTSWYWALMEYRVMFATANIESPEERLRKALKVLVSDSGGESEELMRLHRLIISESSKAYLTREVDNENRDGAYTGYKKLVGIVSEIVNEISPDYPYSRMLISTVIEAAHHQRYFAEHLPRLTDAIPGRDCISEFCLELVFKAIKN